MAIVDDAFDPGSYKKWQAKKAKEESEALERAKNIYRQLSEKNSRGSAAQVDGGESEAADGTPRHGRRRLEIEEERESRKREREAERQREREDLRWNAPNRWNEERREKEQRREEELLEKYDGSFRINGVEYTGTLETAKEVIIDGKSIPCVRAHSYSVRGTFGTEKEKKVYFITPEDYATVKQGDVESPSIPSDMILIVDYRGPGIENPDIQVVDSYRVQDIREINLICDLIAKYTLETNNGGINYERSVSSMVLEWVAHNKLYEYGYQRNRTGSVDLDNAEDRFG
ncbi:MAG: hypothetical protein Q4B42_05650 [Oscillospiraceae bacterium]|nr:hypothetical protein [Oscillospiraceae bacterium]